MNATSENLLTLDGFTQTIPHDTEDHGLKQARKVIQEALDAWRSYGFTFQREHCSWKRTFTFSQCVDRAAEAAYAAYELREEALTLKVTAQDYRKDSEQISIAAVLTASSAAADELAQYMREE